MESLNSLKNQKYLVFSVNNNKFGIEIGMVKEVFKANKIYSLPRTSDIISGVVNLRGSIITIFDLKRIMFNTTQNVTEIKSTKKAKEISIILVRIGAQDIGLFVDQILFLYDIKTFDKVSKSELTMFNSSIMDSIKESCVINQDKIFILNIGKMIENYLVLEEDGMVSDGSFDDFDDFDYEQYTLPSAENVTETIAEEVIVEEKKGDKQKQEKEVKKQDKTKQTTKEEKKSDNDKMADNSEKNDKSISDDESNQE